MFDFSVPLFTFRVVCTSRWSPLHLQRLHIKYFTAAGLKVIDTHCTVDTSFPPLTCTCTYTACIYYWSNVYISLYHTITLFNSHMYMYMCTYIRGSGAFWGIPTVLYNVCQNHKTLVHMHPINLASLELKEGDSDTIQYKWHQGMHACILIIRFPVSVVIYVQDCDMV